MLCFLFRKICKAEIDICFVELVLVVLIEPIYKQTADNAGQDIAHATGFNAKSTFNAAFLKVAGMTPSAWRSLQAPKSPG